MNRRSFLSSCLAMAAAPAIVRADSLMRIVPREAVIVGADFVGVPNGQLTVLATFRNGLLLSTRIISPTEEFTFYPDRLAHIGALTNDPRH